MADAPEHRYAYLHGFASGPLSKKGQHLREVFAERGIELALPDLNQPSFAELSPTACLGAIEALDGPRSEKRGVLRFVGSSFGGWLAARWAELHPDRIDRMVLLCPGFDLAERWPTLFGAEQMARWGQDGVLYLADGAGVQTPVHYGFYVESLNQPGRPVVPCPTLIIHGKDDETVPIEGSRSYAAEHDQVTLIEVDDGHDLMASLDRITDETLRFFDL